MDFDSNGLLEAGIHNCSASEFVAFFVDNFPTSQRRKMIADTLFEFAKEIFAIGVPFEFWVDGSFVTSKINPNDVDVILFLQAPAMKVLSPLQLTLKQKYNGLIDLYFSFATSPENEALFTPSDYWNLCVNQRNYWRGQFGFDRKDNPKGIIRLDCTSVIEYLKGR